MSTAALHMIGNAHIDPVWLWQWQEGFHEVRATFRSALDRMKDYPEFKFVASSAAFYQWIEENDPSMFSEIQQRVSEGRWGVVGGWWIEPDCNIPGGESFVRQGLYGQRYFKSRFGVTASTGYNIDSFGHHGMLPQILRKSGLKYYVFMRPDPNEKNLPGRVFWWESNDGSRILTLRLPAAYGTWGQDIGSHIQHCASEITPPLEEMVCFYGVGDHGGGPTIANIENILHLRQKPDYPHLLFSTPDAFFTSVISHDPILPVVHDDLQHHSSGCYSAHSGIKRWVRQAENDLITAEKFSVVATHLTGLKYPENFPDAWKSLLFNQFHDILAGTSLEIAYEDSHRQLGETMSAANRALISAAHSIAWNISITQQKGVYHLVAFNPHPWSCRINLELEMGLLTGNEVFDHLTLRDSQGVQLPIQLVQSQATTLFRARTAFIADLPPFGYALYHINPQNEVSPFPDMPASDSLIENNHLRMEIEPEKGCIKSLYDKHNSCEIFSDPAAYPEVINDPSDTWSHGVLKFDQLAGYFTPRKVSLVEHGPVKSIIRVESTFERSTLIQDFTLFQDINLLRVDVTVDWHGHNQLLKLRFPVNVSSPQATYEIPYGYIQRPTNGIEFPGQSWLDLSGISTRNGIDYGVSLLNDCKYSFDILDNVIGMTVLRSPIFAHHTPAEPDPRLTYTYIDQGIQHFTYTILPHLGSWREAGTVKRAIELNQPPFVLAATSHPGNLPEINSFMDVDQENIIVKVLKKSEDSSDLILRAYESSGKGVQVQISLPFLGRNIETYFTPCEIKTLKVPLSLTSPVIETDMLEYPL